MVMTDPSFTALGLMAVATLAKKFGWDFYEKLRENDIMVVQGNQQVSDMLKRGERLIAAGALDSYAADDAQGRATRSPRSIRPKARLIIPSPTAIMKGAPNPNAAKLFAEFMLSEAGTETVSRGRRLCRARRHRSAAGQPQARRRQGDPDRLRCRSRKRPRR